MTEVLRFLRMSSFADEQLKIKDANEHLLQMRRRSNQKTSPE